MLDIPTALAFSKSIPGDSSSHVFLKIINVANDLPGDLLQNLSLWLAISTFSLKRKIGFKKMLSKRMHNHQAKHQEEMKHKNILPKQTCCSCQNKEDMYPRRHVSRYKFEIFLGKDKMFSLV